MSLKYEPASEPLHISVTPSTLNPNRRTRLAVGRTSNSEEEQNDDTFDHQC